MNQFINEFWQTWNDPHARHAFLVHAPLVLGGLGFVPLIGFAVSGFKSKPMRLVCVVWFLAMSGLCAMAANAGESAETSLHALTPPQTHTEHEAIERHEELGEDGWKWPLIPAALTLVTFVPRKGVRYGAGAAAIAGAVGVAVWIAMTGHAGGRLVYVYGLGVPSRGAEASVAPGVPKEGGAPSRDHD